MREVYSNGPCSDGSSGCCQRGFHLGTGTKRHIPAQIPAPEPRRSLRGSTNGKRELETGFGGGSEESKAGAGLPMYHSGAEKGCKVNFGLGSTKRIKHQVQHFSLHAAHTHPK